MKIKCFICDKKITSGRKCIHTGRVYCNSDSCAGEYFLNNTNVWGVILKF